MVELTDPQIRERILAVLYGVWKTKGPGIFVTTNEIASALNMDFIAVDRNLDVLEALGLVKVQRFLGGGAIVQITANGVLECERREIQPDLSLLKEQV